MTGTRRTLALLLLLLLPPLLAAAAPRPAQAGAADAVLADSPSGPLVTAADLERELKAMPPPVAAALETPQKAELLETLVGRRLVERELAATPPDTDPVYLARIEAVNDLTLLRHHMIALERDFARTGEAALREWHARHIDRFGNRPFEALSGEVAAAAAARRIEEALDAQYREALAADPARTGEADLLFERMLEAPDPALAPKPLFSFREGRPFTFIAAYGVFDTARVREGATLHEARTNREAWLERFLKSAVIRRVAERAGVGADPGFVAEREAVLRNMALAWRVTKGIAGARATTAEIDAFYANHPELFTSGGESRVRLIRATSEVAAREIKARLDAGGAFEALARERSAHPSAARGGDIGAVRASPDLPGHLRPALFIEPGRVSDVVSSAEGFFLLEVTARNPARTTPVEFVRDRIKLLVEREKTRDARRAYFAGLRKKYDVKLYPERLK